MSPTDADVPLALRDVKAVFFDFMGTCLDWHTGIVKAFPLRYPERVRIILSLTWREAFFSDIHHRFESGLPPEDIDITHARLLAQLLEEDSRFSDIVLDESEQHLAVRAWHNMTPWPDVPAALDKLRAKYEIFVLANGTTRLQLDLMRSSNLHFNMLFSSQLLGETKPDPKIYLKALNLVGVEPQQAVMVAAHAYDLRAARKVGLRTVYIHRTTEDLAESMTRVRSEVDVFVDGRQGTATCGLSELARLMAA